MSDKNNYDRDEYWRELFDAEKASGGEFSEWEEKPEIIETGVNSTDLPGEWFDIDNVSTAGKGPRAPEEKNSAPKEDFSDTSVIPSDVKSISDTISRKKAKEEQPKEAEDDGFERPIRRDRRKRTGIMGGLMYFAFVIGISVLLASLGWIAASDIMGFGKEEGLVEIVVEEDFNIDELADQLKTAGLINYPFLFKIYSSFSNAADKIDPGTYELNTNFDYWAIVANMQFGAGMQKTVKVTLVEGKTMAEIFTILEENGVCRMADLIEAATNYDFDYGFLDSATIGDEKRLEGYLFPDTYEFYVGDGAVNVIRKFLANFNSKITEEMYETAEALGYTMAEIVTIASIIEKETDGTDRAIIASVISNRLGSSYPYLEIDATVIYAIPDFKAPVTYADLEYDSPYNTYMYPGLPVGPISNPGIKSIQAALAPESTNYFYYALDTETQLHKFFSNYDDFTAFTATQNYND